MPKPKDEQTGHSCRQDPRLQGRAPNFRRGGVTGWGQDRDEVRTRQGQDRDKIGTRQGQERDKIWKGESKEG